MIVRRGPAIVLSLALSAAALSGAPALAVDGGAAKVVPAKPPVDRDECDEATPTRAKLRVTTLDGNDTRLEVTATVWSDDRDVWVWKLRHNGEVSDDGKARGSEDEDISFRIVRTMINFYGTDDVAFRAENQRTGEVCRTSVEY